MTYKKDHPYTFAKGLLFKAYEERHLSPLFGAYFQHADSICVISLNSVISAQEVKDWRTMLNTKKIELLLNHPRSVSIEYVNGTSENDIALKKADGVVVFAKENAYFDSNDLNWHKGITFSVTPFTKDQASTDIELQKEFYHICVNDGKIDIFKVERDFDGNTQSDYFKTLKPLGKKDDTPLFLSGIQVLHTYVNSRNYDAIKAYVYSEVMYYHFGKPT